ncbi:sugar kinase [Siculibacillus lacustris]|uniref:Sugar kinase n=1 Tax=Siculibacillus lacustris TaxID=1549641 RepID=A0A4Q9VP83_9HYPH|nr:sugar kinase [Siculibacillus lacustris]TBW36612.1 sugar kinase [Siculibacillus lacustris]
MRVAVLGECMVEIRHVDADNARFSFGGDVLNTAIYLTRLGLPTRFVTALGDDRYSDRMIERWTAEGVLTDAVRIMPRRLPGMYVIETSPNGERRFLYWRTDSPARDIFTAAQAEETTRWLLDTDVLFLSGITLSLYGEAGLWRLFAALKQARRIGVRIVLDTNFRPRNWPDLSIARAAFSELADVVDIVLAGDEDLGLLFGTADAEATLRDWLDFDRTEVVLKCGKGDCRIWAQGAQYRVAAERVDDVVDTTAAGDSFAAAYLASRLRGGAPDAAARDGHRLAATVIRHPGAIIPRSAMPDFAV